MNPIWMIPAIVGYFVAALGYTTSRLGLAPSGARWGKFALAGGVAAHILVLAVTALQAGNIPVTNLPESISFLSALTALAALPLINRLRLIVIGAFIAPFAFIATTIAALTMPGQRLQMPDALRSAWLPVHVTLAFAGFALFVLAAGVSLVYLINERRLKTKRLTAPTDERMPSLEKLDRINYRLLGMGFLMLSLAIVTGAIWADATWGRFWSWEPQESWSLVVWLMYAALLESRLTVGWRGRRVAALTLVVFTVLISSFVGVSLVTPGKHGGSFG
ncbi:MAG TPA: c-type cytochrome biogenesis protein CcsB [Candidatus Binataceae bacterium]|nr:c-type cytochrome biogenesis protein CcsB [Candidatus Binataceae bacterium]